MSALMMEIDSLSNPEETESLVPGPTTENGDQTAKNISPVPRLSIASLPRSRSLEEIKVVENEPRLTANYTKMKRHSTGNDPFLHRQSFTTEVTELETVCISGIGSEEDPAAQIPRSGVVVKINQARNSSIERCRRSRSSVHRVARRLCSHKSFSVLSCLCCNPVCGLLALAFSSASQNARERGNNPEADRLAWQACVCGSLAFLTTGVIVLSGLFATGVLGI